MLKLFRCLFFGGRTPSVDKISSFEYENETDNTAPSTNKLVDEILACYAILSRLASLEPLEEVNDVFGRLVATCILNLGETAADKIISHPCVLRIIPHLRILCSIGESKLEAFWADRIVSSDLALNNFPYYKNYIDLTRLELSLIHTAHESPRRFVFLGCGPLPLTSFCIADQLRNEDVSILNIDISQTAISSATAISKHLGYSEWSMTFCRDKVGGSRHSLQDAEVVYLAALVGTNCEEKKEIVRSVVLAMKPGALLIIRTAWGLRKLLYPALRVPEDLDIPRLELLTLVHPYNDIVNSVILCRVRG